eukprot:6825716-Pyramimonas_sp.AAC.1
MKGTLTGHVQACDETRIATPANRQFAVSADPVRGEDFLQLGTPWTSTLRPDSPEFQTPPPGISKPFSDNAVAFSLVMNKCLQTANLLSAS